MTEEFGQNLERYIAKEADDATCKNARIEYHAEVVTLFLQQ